MVKKKKNRFHLTQLREPDLTFMIPYHIRVVYHKYAHQGSLELLTNVLSSFHSYFFILEVTIVSGMPKNKKR